MARRLFRQLGTKPVRGNMQIAADTFAEVSEFDGAAGCFWWLRARRQ
jgi:hypothetical protein